MEPLRILTASEQVAEHLRAEVARWRREDSVPGVNRLAAELGVGKDTAEAALRQLEREGLIETRGRRRRRKVTSTTACGQSTLQIAFLDFEPPDHTDQWVRDLRQRLVNAGHRVTMSRQSLLQLKMDPRRVARLLRTVRADAWVVFSATPNVLRVFQEHNLPTMAIAGGWKGLPVAGLVPNKHPALDAAMESLLSRRHRRIAMITRSAIRNASPTGFAARFLDNLKDHGVPTGPFNLPNWREDPDGLCHMLEGLFGITPPTALIIDEAYQFFAVQQFLLSRGLKVPDDVSLICTDYDPHFAWCRPSVAHIRWDFRKLASHVLRWARNVEKGRTDTRQKFIRAEFVNGGTVGWTRAAPGGSARG